MENLLVRGYGQLSVIRLFHSLALGSVIHCPRWAAASSSTGTPSTSRDDSNDFKTFFLICLGLSVFFLAGAVIALNTGCIWRRRLRSYLENYMQEVPWTWGKYHLSKSYLEWVGESNVEDILIADTQQNYGHNCLNNGDQITANPDKQATYDVLGGGKRAVGDVIYDTTTDTSAKKPSAIPLSNSHQDAQVEYTTLDHSSSVLVHTASSNFDLQESASDVKLCGSENETTF